MGIGFGQLSVMESCNGGIRMLLSKMLPNRMLHDRMLPNRQSRARVWCAAALSLACVTGVTAFAQHPAEVWLTTADRANLLAQQHSLKWGPVHSAAEAVVVDDARTYQTMDGFGHALTGGSAELLMKMSAGARTALLQELFGDGPKDVHTSYLRVTVGSSDMNDHVYTYDDLPAGTTDPSLQHFSLAPDEQSVIPALRQILAIEPRLKILASPWTAPVWMKDNASFRAGSLKPEFYETYAQYWVKYLQGMQAEGIHIDALTPQNEPENGNNTPSMLMTAEQEADFIGRYLGPALRAAGLRTKIIAFDHNCDHPVYSETVLRDAQAARYTDGSGFHLYAGEISALSEVHDAFPAKNIYFTEQMVIPGRDPAVLDIAEPVARLIIGAPANWSRNVLLWNLAADSQNGPHTDHGGCPICSGALRIDGDHVDRLVAYYVTAQASKFVPPGSVRIGSDGLSSLPHVAFRTPSGKHVLIVSNTGTESVAFPVRFQHSEMTARLPAGAVATYVW
jgi:glucosylceramidase